MIIIFSISGACPLQKAEVICIGIQHSNKEKIISSGYAFSYKANPTLINSPQLATEKTGI